MAKKYIADTFEGGAGNLTGLAVNTDELVVSSGKVGIGTSSPSGSLSAGGLDVVDRIAVGSGSVGTPALHYRDDTDTGIYFGTGIVNLVTAGSERMRIDSSGNVGIGATNPDSLLHVFGNTGSTNIPRIKIEASGWSNDCRIERSSGSDGFYITNNYDTSATSTDNSNAGTSGVQMARGHFAVHTGASGAFSERMRINSSGNVGIGTGANVDEKLHIQGSVDDDDIALKIENTFDDNSSATPPSAAVIFSTASNNGYIRVFGAPADTAANHKMDIGATASSSYLTFSPNGSERMRIDSDGNVGIGTSTPGTFKLDVAGSARSNFFALRLNQSLPSESSAIYRPATGTFAIVTSAAERMRIDSSGVVQIKNVSSPTLQLFNTDTSLAFNQVIGDIDFYQSDPSGTGVGVVSKIRSINLSSFEGQAGLAFHTGTASGLTESMRISSSGNVGIGENSPDRQLHLKSSLPAIRLEDSDVSGLYHEFFASTSGMFQFKADGGNVQSSSGFLFQVDNSEKMRIDSNGNVGIGTSNISEKLEVVGGDVNGTVRISANESDSCFLTIGASTTETRIVSSSYGSFGHLTFYTGGQHRMRIQSSGNVLIGKTSAGVNTAGLELNPIGLVQASRDGNLPLLVNRLTSDGTVVSIRRDNNQRGSISVSGSTTSFNTTSDYRLKENVVDMTGALDRVDQLQPKRFNFISEETTVDGFIAHEVQSVIPEAITGEKDAVDENGNPEYQGIDQSKIVPLLVGAIKELKAEIETLKSQINS